MYGLVNIAIRDLILGEHGPEIWDRILERAGVPHSTFVGMERYPDSMTYDLVGAASEVLGAPAEDLLRVFGEYWMTFTAEKGYGETLEFAGSTFREFLENLDEMHARISLSFPHLQPPSFDLEELEDGRLELHYHTDRPGLAPMVIGLLNGLAKRFGQEIDLIHEGPEQEGGHDRFLMSVRDQAESEAA